MSDYFQRIEVPRAIALYEHIFKLQAKARVAGRPDIVAELNLLLSTLRAELIALSSSTAVFADERAKHFLEARRKRPDTDKQLHLSDLIVSEPTRAVLGGVGLFRLDELDRAINPNGGSRRSYWRAIEYGLDEGFVGRKLFGSFYFPGGNAPPSRQAIGGAEHAAFRSRPSSGSDEDAGWATISRPIRAEKFLHDGARVAESRYLKRLAELDTASARGIDGIGRFRRR